MSIDARWPDAEARATRKAALLDRLSAWLDVFVECEQGAWAKASEEDVNELSSIYREIADLKFQRDCDGDSVIDYDIVNRRYGRLISVFEPYGIDRVAALSDRVIVDYLASTMRAIEYLDRSSARLSGYVRSIVGGAQQVFIRADEADKEIQLADALLKNDPSSGDLVLAEQHLDTADRHGGVTAPLRAKLFGYLRDTVTPSLARIDDLLDSDTEEATQTAREILQPLRRRFGEDALDLWQRAIAKGAADQRFRRLLLSDMKAQGIDLPTTPTTLAIRVATWPSNDSYSRLLNNAQSVSMGDGFKAHVIKREKTEQDVIFTIEFTHLDKKEK